MTKKRHSIADLPNVVQIEGDLSPVSDKKLAAFQKASGRQLPRGYLDFCKVLGPGSLRACIWIHISVPGCNLGSDEAALAKFDIEVLNRYVWETSLFELDEYCDQADLVRKGLFFASDIYTHQYFWKTDEVTNQATHEMAIYAIYRENTVHRLADSFESFIYDICLRNGIPNHGKLDYDPPIFEAASKD